MSNNHHNITLLNTDWIRKLQTAKNIRAASKVEPPSELREYPEVDDAEHFRQAFHAEFFDPRRKRTLEVEALELKLYQQSVYIELLESEVIELRKARQHDFVVNCILCLAMITISILQWL